MSNLLHLLMILCQKAILNSVKGPIIPYLHFRKLLGSNPADPILSNNNKQNVQIIPEILLL